MDASQALWQEVTDVFEEALELPCGARERILRSRCRSEEVANEVRRLLGEHERAGLFLDPGAEAEPSNEPLPPTFAAGEIIAGRFRVVRILGAGGMGEVYEAADQQLLQNVALKTIRPELLANSQLANRFRSEVLRSRKITHANVARVYDLFEHRLPSGEERLFFTMELLDGETLSTRLLRGPIPIGEAFQILRQIAGALDAAHQADIVHRDLKPGNVFLCGGPGASLRVVIADFGIASEAGATTAGQGMPGQASAASFLSGTPAYMSPEQLLGDANTPRTDVYAMGLLAHEMLSGHSPFTGRSLLACSLEKLGPCFRLEFPPDRKIPPRWVAAISRCIEVEPDKRFSTPAEFIASLATRKPMPRRNLLRGAAGLAVTAPLAWLWRNAGAAAGSSIAVLPFETRGKDPSMAYYGDGIAEDLTQALTIYPALHVAAQSAAARFRSASGTLKEAARTLGVRYLVAGSVNRDAGRVMLSVQLIEGATTRELWSQRYDRSEREIFVLQQEILAELATRLKAGEPRGGRAKGTTNVEAYDAYLKGKAAQNNRTREGLLHSLEFYASALRLDPEFAPAMTASASAFIAMTDYGWMAPEEVRPKVREMLQSALRIDPDSAETLSVLGYFDNLIEWDQDGAERAFQRAIQLSPSLSSARLNYANFLLRGDRLDAALREAQVARTFDLVSPAAHLLEAWVRYYRREYRQAVQICQENIGKDPSLPHGYRLLALVYAALQDEKNALVANDEAVKRFNDPAVIHRQKAWVFSRLGDRRKEARMELEAMSRADPGRQIGFIPFIYAGIGDRNEMYRSAREAVQIRDSAFLMANVDPAFDPYRKEREMLALLRETGYRR
jgi:serine/threonine-protein kinase